jgi:hypothetical protein
MKKILWAILLLLSLTANAQHTVDVTVASNGCPAAVANDSADDLAAIQCQVNYLHANHGGGILLFPSGLYDVSATIHVPSGEILTGVSPHTTTIQSIGLSDIKVLEFAGSHNSFGGLERIRIICSQSTAATQSCVHVLHNTPVIMRDFHIWGGLHALLQDGVDGYHENGIVAAMARGGVNLFSRGANWYHRVKFNPYAGQTVAFAYAQNTWAQTPNNGVQENHFSQCDFSGNFDYGVGIYDAGLNQAVTTFEGSVISGSVYVWAARATLFTGMEFGSQTLVSDAPISVTGSYAFNATGIGGSGVKACAGNIGISC